MLGKRKPRGIISAGDEGVILHLFDSAVFEKLLFSNPLFEARSIKHADFNEYAQGVGDFVRAYDMNASTDCGAFDGSCTTKVRDSMENMILKRLFSNVLGDGETVTHVLREALRDRNKRECNMKLGAFIRIKIEDMIRESGDRGTSILNFITNYAMFLAAAHMLMSDAKVDHKMMERVIYESMRHGEWLNIM